MSWHVDYWDNLGWKDPFGSKAFSGRQTRYAKALELKNRWTPMLLVDNQPVRGAQLKESIAKAQERDPVFDAVVSSALKGGKVEGRVNLRPLDPKLELGADVVVQFVLFQRRVKTDCKAGENKGAMLEEFFVVRAAPEPLDRAAALAKGAPFAVPAPKGVSAKDLGVAILLEDSKQMTTLGCWWTPVVAN